MQNPRPHPKPAESEFALMNSSDGSVHMTVSITVIFFFFFFFSAGEVLARSVNFRHVFRGRMEGAIWENLRPKFYDSLQKGSL